ncbi:MAG: efflux RND transporter periplasmic adaptor subunit [Myxococcales bacterium]|nr:efflux RND transporter periplasmic adaptor subunit [Polyangiaceae bacterium]MDW8247963.1 efflux RND transporter periplasmic adaptor subunit [Myxococcales bacterium]
MREPRETKSTGPSWVETLGAWGVTAALLGGLAFFLVSSKPPRMAKAPSLENVMGGVQIPGPRRLLIAPEAPLMKKLHTGVVRVERTEAPVLEVSGAVIASLPREGKLSEERWQFASPELLMAYAEWAKSGTDVAFTRKQLATTRALHETRVNTQTKVVERLRKLVEAGSDAPKDLALEEANLVQLRLEGQKEIHEAQIAVRNAERTQGALERQLQQAGLDPQLLRTTSAGQALLVAEVPESRLDRAREGQSCTARFYGLPGAGFRGKVSRISPTVSREQRTLRVLVALEDREGKLKPGMFADVGLGTDPREAVLITSDSVLHIGRSDYVLKKVGAGEWLVTEVTLGETRGEEIEVLRGIQPGDEVLGKGAILLKHMVIEALQKEGAPR